MHRRQRFDVMVWRVCELSMCQLCAISHMMYIHDTGTNSYGYTVALHTGLSFMKTGTFGKKKIASTSTSQDSM